MASTPATAAPETSASASAPPMKGHPEESSRNDGPRLPASLTVAVSPDNVFHPVFQLQLAFLEGHFFELFWF
jgi:hypothetical protein